MSILKHPTPKEIKDLRLSIDLSQEQAGGLLHINGRHFRRWEIGQSKMPLAYWELFTVKVRVMTAKKNNRPMA
jgi:DNA-binding transcriptional regulator YiaG|tara:strand:+ start:1652 stop:1870 length:219 start_codon:yes stop_codon:yes gene_type:complete